MDYDEVRDLWDLDRETFESYWQEYGDSIPDCPNCGAKGILENNWRGLMSPFAVNESMALKEYILWIFGPAAKIRILKSNIRVLESNGREITRDIDKLEERLASSRKHVVIVWCLLAAAIIGRIGGLVW